MFPLCGLAGCRMGLGYSMINITTDYLVFFGAASVILGMLGYVRAKSLPSLVMGGIFGLGLVASSVMILKGLQSNNSATMGLVVALVLSVLLLGRFLPAFLKTKAFYPAGIMALLALGGTVLTILSLVQR